MCSQEKHKKKRHTSKTNLSMASILLSMVFTHLKVCSMVQTKVLCYIMYISSGLFGFPIANKGEH